jgi:hypothetical protein
MSVPTRAELDALVRERLASAPDFRAELLAAPRPAVSKLLGITLPPAVAVEVHEETLTHIHLVIPAQDAPGQISDSDLELVAGGMCWSDSCTSGVPP